MWMVLQLRNFEGIRIGLGRKELTRLKQTTIITLTKEVHPMFGITDDEFRYNEQKSTIEYINGSLIQLIDLAWMPSDPDFDRFGSLLLTHALIEEAGEIVKKAKDVFTSRKNRFLNKEHGIVGKSVSTCNPSQNFLKTEYYKPYKKQGAGDFQKWEHGKVIVSGEKRVAYRAFIQSLVTDNPFAPPNYIEVLRMLPPAERKRLLEGNWDYTDDDLVLFKSLLIDRCLDDTATSGTRYVGVDVADSGDDETILTLVESDMIVEQKKIVVDKNEAIGEQIALEIIKYAQQNGIHADHASQVAIDVVGIGASTRDFMRSKGWRVLEFSAGSGSAHEKYKNLRGETIYEMYLAMDKGDFKIHSRLSTMEDLRTQLMAHEYTTEERKILIKSKKDIKKELGRSPDNAESAYIAFWASRGSKNDPRRDSSRIII